MDASSNQDQPQTNSGASSLLNAVLGTAAKGTAAVITVLTLLTLVIAVAKDWDWVETLYKPNPPLEGKWESLTASDIYFCFEKKDRLVWGAFVDVNTNAPISAIDGYVDGNDFTLEYERVADHMPADWGLLRLSYSESDGNRFLTGFWKSLQSRAPAADSVMTNWARTRDFIELKKVAGSCDVRIPEPKPN